MARQAVVVYAAFAASLSVHAFLPEASYSFDDYIADFGRGYQLGTEEYDHRKTIFEERLRSILAHNADASKTWQRGVNDFMDLSPGEFRAGRLGLDRKLARGFEGRQGHSSNAQRSEISIRSEELPSSWDWREKGVISDVKAQGLCGSCWAFATTATLESHVALATGTLEVLSPQQLVSCAPNPLQCGGVGGCQGSIPEVAYQYVQLYGMTTEWRAPYTSYFGKSEPCSFNGSQTPAVIEISGYQKLPPNDYQAVMQALVTIGPLAVNVQADVWSDYHSGVFTGCSNASDVHIDHVVQLVGFGTDPKGGDYWLIRNSWDATWGEKGYIRLKRSSTPECGDDKEPLDGTGCAGGPSVQHVCGQCGVLFDVSYPLGARMVTHGPHVIQV